MALTDTPVTSEHLSAASGVGSASTSTTFSPTAGQMVVVRVVNFYSSAPGSSTTLSVTDSHSNSYTAAIQAQNTFHEAGAGIFYFVYSSAPGSTTLTISSSVTTNSQEFEVSPSIVGGQAASPIGPNTINIVPSGSITSLTASLTTTQTGSRVYVAGGVGNGSVMTTVAGQTQTDNWAGFQEGATGISSATTGTPGATTFGWTCSPASAFGGNLIAIEVLPAGGTSHNDTAAVTVTPVVSAPRIHAATDTAALAVTPVMSAPRVHAALDLAAVSVAPAESATAAVTLPQLAISIAGQPGTDPRTGQNYLEGIGLYGPGSQVLSLTLAGGGLLIALVPANVAHMTVAPQIFALAENPGAANEFGFLVISSGKEGLNDAAIQLWSETADGTGAAQAVFEFGGTVAAIMRAAGLYIEGWTAATLSGTWAGSGSGVNGVRYQKLPIGVNGAVWLQGDVINTTATGNSVCAVLPSGYRPAVAQNNPAGWNNPQASNAASAPYLFVDTAGNVQLTAIETANKEIFFSVIFPL